MIFVIVLILIFIGKSYAKARLQQLVHLEAGVSIRLRESLPDSTDIKESDAARFIPSQPKLQRMYYWLVHAGKILINLIQTSFLTL
ncbi:hypothetical protein BH11BAC3_BH11BAC3_29640 [soil metagenome]